jgi:hypothetical protein
VGQHLRAGRSSNGRVPEQESIHGDALSRGNGSTSVVVNCDVPSRTTGDGARLDLRRRSDATAGGGVDDRVGRGGTLLQHISNHWCGRDGASFPSSS